MEAQFDDDLRLLINALRQATFRFILIGHNRYSLYKDITARIESLYPTRTVVLRLTGKNYRQIADEITSIKTDIVLIPDFGWLFQSGNEDTCVAFNQRRDAFARLNIAFVCFIEPNEFAQVPYKVPDWWSLRSLELDFHRDTSDETELFQLAELDTKSSLGGQTKEEKEIEIDRLLQQISKSDPENKSLLALLHSQVGSILIDLSSFEIASSHLLQGLNLSREAGDTSIEATILSYLGYIDSERGNSEISLNYLQQSLELKTNNEDKSGIAALLNNIGEIHISQGNYELALNYLEKSLDIQQQVGDQRGIGSTLNNIGQLFKEQGNYVKAQEYLQKSLETQKDNRDLSILGTVLNNLGLLYDTQGNYATALEYLQQSNRIRQQIGDKNGLAITLTNLGAVYFEHYQDIKKAIPLLKQSYDIFEQIGSINVKNPQFYLNAIREQIGNERYNELIQSV